LNNTMVSTPHVNVALAGISGYGDAYLDVLLAGGRANGARLVGVVDPHPQRCRHADELRRAGTPVYASVEALFDVQPVDLLMVVTPIHLHAPITCLALERGMNVLCEKPLAGTLRDAVRMAEVARTARGFAAIGYQWSFSEAVQSLKRDVMAGRLGRPVRLRSLVFSPRPEAYFRRNDWAGRIRTSGGLGVLDSPVNNANSHFLHNMFYVLGRTRQTSAVPVSVEAELYRGNAVENYDTAALRCRTEDGTEVLFYTSHAVPDRVGPACRFEFEDAVVDYDGAAAGQFTARFHNGETRNYGSPNVDRHEKIWQSVDSVRTGRPVACGIDAAMSHTLCVVAAQESCPGITDLPAALKRRTRIDGEPAVYVEGLAAALRNTYDLGVLPSELGTLAWAGAGKPVDLTSRDWAHRRRYHDAPLAIRA
jgi:predicted dehydrogenase